VTSVVVAVTLACAGTALAGTSDESTAKKLVLTKADVGRGFVSEPALADASRFPEMAQCVGKSIAGREVVTHLDGSTLVDEDALVTINSNVDILKTQKMVSADVAVVKDLHFPDCYAEVLDRAAGYGTQVDTKRVKLKRYGDYSTALLTRVESDRESGDEVASIVTVLIQRGRAELLAQFLTESSTPFPRASVQKILVELDERLDAANV
jgi:hypothetical protein